ncbi:hypothetical protein OIE66_17470 [Nonomuraea sp. NBC_01738]|nr:hypothetical protein OIE66_17470 [Nonomuraea sp. NBC_01738]
MIATARARLVELVARRTRAVTPPMTTTNPNRPAIMIVFGL